VVRSQTRRELDRQLLQIQAHTTEFRSSDMRSQDGIRAHGGR
jgi:hypothetical protein